MTVTLGAWSAGSTVAIVEAIFIKDKCPDGTKLYSGRYYEHKCSAWRPVVFDDKGMSLCKNACLDKFLGVIDEYLLNYIFKLDHNVIALEKNKEVLTRRIDTLEAKVFGQSVFDSCASISPVTNHVVKNKPKFWRCW